MKIFPHIKKFLVQVTAKCHVSPLKIEDKKCLKTCNTGEGVEKLTLFFPLDKVHTKAFSLEGKLAVFFKY